MWTIMKYLTWRRLINIVLLRSSFYLSRLTKKVVLLGNPYFLSIEPVNFCNLHCPECPVGIGVSPNQKSVMSLDKYEKIIEEQKKTLWYLILYFQGEPLLHKQFSALVKFAHDRNIFTHTSTNAQLLSDEMAKELVLSRLDKLIISIDGTTQEVYETYRVGGKLEKAVEGLKNIVEWKKRLHSKSPQVEVQFIVLKTNEHQLPEIKKVAKSWGADKIVLKTAQLYDYENGHPLMPSPKYSRYIQNPDGTYRLKKKIKNRCWRQWSGAVVTADGKLLPCCFDKQVEHAFGQSDNKSLLEIWRNKKAMMFRQQLLTNRKAVEICRNCSE